MASSREAGLSDRHPSDKIDRGAIRTECSFRAAGHPASLFEGQALLSGSRASPFKKVRFGRQWQTTSVPGMAGAHVTCATQNAVIDALTRIEAALNSVKAAASDGSPA